MVSVEELRQQTATARALAEQKRAEAQQISRQLEEQEQALPSSTSQEARRSKFAGLNGRNIRRQIERARGEISARQQALAQYEQEVLSPYEQEIIKSESSLEDYGKREQAVEKVRSIIGSKTTASGVTWEQKLAMTAQYGKGYEREYAEQALQDIYAGRDFNDRLDEAVSKYNLGQTEEEAFKGLNLEYLKKTGRVQFENVPSSIPSAVAQQNVFFNTDNLDELRQSTAFGPREGRIRQVFTGSMIPLVSAAPVGPLQGRSIDSNIIPISQGGTGWEVQPAPTRLEKFKEKIGQEGYIKGGISFLSSQLAEGYSKQEQEQYAAGQKGAYYQSPYFTKLVSAAPYAIYFTPIGGPLLVAGAAEEVLTPSGRERIEERTKQIESYGVPEGLAKVGSLAVPATEAYFGTTATLGLFSSSRIKLPEGQRFDNFGKKIEESPRFEDLNIKRELRLDKRATEFRSKLGLNKVSNIYTESISPFASSIRRQTLSGLRTVRGKADYIGSKVFGDLPNINYGRIQKIEGLSQNQPLRYGFTPSQRNVLRRYGSRQGGVLGYARGEIGVGRRVSQVVGKITKPIKSKTRYFSDVLFGDLPKISYGRVSKTQEVINQPLGIKFTPSQERLLSYGDETWGIIGRPNQNLLLLRGKERLGRLGQEVATRIKRGPFSLEFNPQQMEELQLFGSRRGGVIGGVREPQFFRNIGKQVNLLGQGVKSKTRYFSDVLFGDLPKISGSRLSKLERLRAGPFNTGFVESRFATFRKFAGSEGGLFGFGRVPKPEVKPDFIITRLPKTSVPRARFNPLEPIKRKVSGRIEQARFNLEALRRAFSPQRTYSKRLREFRRGPRSPLILNIKETPRTTTSVQQTPSDSTRPQQLIQLKSPEPTFDIGTRVVTPEWDIPSIAPASLLGLTTSFKLGGIPSRRESLIFRGLEVPRDDFFSGTEPKARTGLRGSSIELIGPRIDITPKPRQTPFFSDIPTSDFKIRTRPRTAQDTRIGQREIIEQRKKPLLVKLPRPQVGPQSKVLSSALDKLGFDVFLKRRGRDVKVGTAQTQTEAERLLFKGLRGSLAASGQIRTGGKAVSVNWLGPEFTPSKRDRFRVVQRRQFRLSSGAERQEIRASKRSADWFGNSKRNKSKKLRWF